MLPMSRFHDICLKLYVASEKVSEVEYILANGFLGYAFFEHVLESRNEQYRQYCKMCQDNMHQALESLPLLLTPSLEAIAALTFGVGVSAPHWAFSDLY